MIGLQAVTASSVKEKSQCKNFNACVKFEREPMIMTFKTHWIGRTTNKISLPTALSTGKVLRVGQEYNVVIWLTFDVMFTGGLSGLIAVMCQ